MAKIADLTLKGVSGNSYTFEVFPMGTSFNAIGGVYYISKRVNRNHTNIYVGQTGDLSERFKNHHKANCFLKHNANCISVYRCDSEDRRLLVEQDLIAGLNPPCNG